MELIKGTASTQDDSGFTKEVLRAPTLAEYKGQYGYKSAKFDVSEDKIIHDAYYGCGGFRDGSYLVPFPVEKDNYPFRKEISVYSNIFKKAMRAIFIPASKGNEKRYTEDEIINLFLKNIDNGGIKKIDSFMRDVALNYTIHGYALGFMASPSGNTQTVTKNDLKNKRLFPYCKLINPLNIVDGSDLADSYGALSSITLYDGKITVDKKEYQQYFRIDTERYFKFYLKDDKEVEIESIEHGFGYIPIVSARNGINQYDGLWRPRRDKADFALMATNIYNISSEIRDICRRAGFPMMVVQGLMENTIGVPVGGMLVYPANTNKPEYLSIDTSIIMDQQKLMESAINELLSIAEQAGVQSVNKEAKSGFAMSVEFRGLNENICEIAEMLESFEYDMVAMFCDMQGIENDYVTKYSESYFVGEEVSVADIAVIMDMVGVMPTIKKELNRIIARRIYGAEYDDVADVLDSELESHNFDSDPQPTIDVHA